MNCPRCNQGSSHNATIRKNNQKIIICEECDVIWFKLEDIGSPSYQDFSQYAEKIQLNGLWPKLNVHNY